MRVTGIEFRRLDLEKVKAFLENAPKTQIVGQNAVAGKIHAISSVEQALKAFASGSNICRSEGLEFLVRLSGQRQIQRALAVCEPSRRSVFVCWGKDTFPRFKKEFKVKEIPMKEPRQERLKAALEKTATFWLAK
jgi:tRNA threonylcarbamoyladenosine modification (KEOPS) complex Cgi121 subunit